MTIDNNAVTVSNAHEAISFIREKLVNVKREDRFFHCNWKGKELTVLFNWVQDEKMTILCEEAYTRLMSYNTAENVQNWIDIQNRRQYELVPKIELFFFNFWPIEFKRFKRALHEEQIKIDEYFNASRRIIPIELSNALLKREINYQGNFTSAERANYEAVVKKKMFIP